MKNTKKPILSCVEAPRVATDTVIFAVFDGCLKVLLIRIGKGEYDGCWALPGGLVRMDESLDEAAERVLSQKAGVEGIYLEQLAAFGDLNRDRRGRSVSVAYFALVRGEDHLLRTIEYYSGIEWKDVRNLPKLAFDHRKIVKLAEERLRNKLGYSNIAYGLMPKEFTLTELQSLYETILGNPLDKRNFRKKIKDIGLVTHTGNVRRTERSRPARLYSFTHRKPTMMDVL